MHLGLILLQIYLFISILRDLQFQAKNPCVNQITDECEKDLQLLFGIIFKAMRGMSFNAIAFWLLTHIYNNDTWP